MTGDDVEAAEANIAQTREQLQETVEQLTDRLDPHVEAKEAVESVKHTAAEGVAAARRNPVPVTGVAAAVLGLTVTLVIWKRRDR